MISGDHEFSVDKEPHSDEPEGHHRIHVRVNAKDMGCMLDPPGQFGLDHSKNSEQAMKNAVRALVDRGKKNQPKVKFCPVCCGSFFSN